MPLSAKTKLVDFPGISTDAVEGLKLLDITTVSELAASPVFAAAVKFADAAKGAYGSLPVYTTPLAEFITDRVRYRSPSVRDILDTGIDILLSVPAQHEFNIQAKLKVRFVGDLAVYPLYHAAKGIVDTLHPSNAAAHDDERPADLLPKSREFPIEKVEYTTLVLGDFQSPGSNLDEIQDIDDLCDQIDPTNAADANAGFKTVAYGAVLTFDQSWFSHGVTLGQLLHSVTLAPGESTRIAVVDWSRRSRANLTEDISERDALTNDASHNRALTEVTNSVGNQSQSGFSMGSNSSSSKQSGVSAAMEPGFLGMSFGSGGISSSSSSSQSLSSGTAISAGTRDIAANTLQNAFDLTHQVAHDSRDRRASVVKEVSQSEREEASTRIVTNFNHMHALSVQYYEVVQVYRVQVALKRAERAIFIPFKPPNLNDDRVLHRFRDILIRAALTLDVRIALQRLGTVELILGRSVCYSNLGDKSLAVALESIHSLFEHKVKDAAEDAAEDAAVAPAKDPAKPAVMDALMGAMMDAVKEVVKGAVNDAAKVAAKDATDSATESAVKSSVKKFAEMLSTEPDPRTIVDRATAYTLLRECLWSQGQLESLPNIHQTPMSASESVSLFFPSSAVYAGHTSIVDTENSTYWVRLFSTQSNQVSKGHPLYALSSIAVEATQSCKVTVTLQIDIDGSITHLMLPTIAVSEGIQKVLLTTKSWHKIPSAVTDHLQTNNLHYKQAIIHSLDTAQTAYLLSGYKMEVDGEYVPLFGLVNPAPVGSVGNYLAFKIDVGPDNAAWLKGNNMLEFKDDDAWLEWLKQEGIDNPKAEDRAWFEWLKKKGINMWQPETLTKEGYIPLGTGGVFAEAVLGRSNCAEKLDITRFWNWQDSPPPFKPGDITAVKMGSRATDENVKPGQLSNPIISLAQPAALPNPTGMSSILAAVQNGNMFRNMSGLAETIALNKTAVATNTQAASDAGKHSSESMQNLLQANTERYKATTEMVTKLASTAASVYTARGTSSDDGSKINHLLGQK